MSGWSWLTSDRALVRCPSPVTDLARLGLAVIGFMVAMIAIWLALRRGGWD